MSLKCWWRRCVDAESYKLCVAGVWLVVCLSGAVVSYEGLVRSVSKGLFMFVT